MAVLLGAALVAALAGPLRFDVFGMRLSVRTLSRPLLAAVLGLAARAWLLRGASLPGAAFGAGARVVLGTLLAAALIGWLTFLSTTCGGSDSYGYVSAAYRLKAGSVVQTEPLAHLLPFPNGILAACPLGYAPSGRIENASVPVYPLGVPALMAATLPFLGSSGPFAVAPLMGLVLVWAAFLTARAWYGDVETALVGSALVAINPLVVTYSIQPMSDVPAAAALVAAIAALSRETRLPAIAGLAAGAALLMRPALAPAALVLATLPLIADGRRAWTEVARYLVPVALAACLQAWIQWYLYGDARSSGYGNIASLYSFPTAIVNVRSYGHWSVRALGVVWFGALAVGLGLGTRPSRVTTGLVIPSVALPYLFYRPYDHWETLRFLLPAIVVMTIVAGRGLIAISRRLAGRDGGALLAAGIAVMLAVNWVSWLSANQVFTMPAHEARHALAAELVAEVTGRDAVVLALQHSGSIRHYSGRQTINWEQIPGGALNATVDALQSNGLAVYLMIDSAEERVLFDARHGSALSEGRWLPAGQRRNVQLYEAKD